MNDYLAALIGFLPILSVMFFLVGLRWSALRAMSISYALICLLAISVWRVDALRVLAASLRGVVITGNIFWIILGAIMLLFTLRECGALSVIKNGFVRVSPDRRVQAIIIAWLFGSFMEGVAGFGTPAAVAAPLLLGLGFPALAAVMVTLIIQSTPVTFGGAGIPIFIGFGKALNVPEVMDLLARQGVSMESFMYNTGLYAAMVHAVVGTFIPLIIVCMLTRFFGEKRSLREGLQVWRFALFAGLAFTVPYLTVAFLLGPEFPTISGSLIGLLIVINGAKRGWFLPREGRPWDFPHRSKWEPAWVGTINQTEEPMPENASLFKAWSAYILICFLLVITRLESLGLKKLLTSDAMTIRFVNILGVEGITESISLLYLAGTIFMLATLMTVVIYRMNPRQVGVACRDAVSRLFKPFITLICAVALVRVFIDSDVNAAGLPSMPLQLAEMIAAVSGRLWPLFAAGLGSFGSFIAGSNTVSNLMFALFQFGVAENIGVSHAVVLGLQAVGGAAGNMITIHNIVAACATVGLVGVEGAIIRKTIIPMIYYIVFAGILGLVLCSLIPGGF